MADPGEMFGRDEKQVGGVLRGSICLGALR